MARTRSENYEDIRLGILSKAAKLFASKGYERSSITDLSEACQLSRGALYHYFGSKEAILFAMLDRLVHSLLERLKAAAAPGGAPVETLARVIEAFVEHNARSPDEQVILLNDLGALSEREQNEITRIERQIVNLVADVLVPLNSSRKITRSTKKIYTMMLVGIVNYTFTWYDPKGSVSPKQFAHMATDLFLNGFLKTGDIASEAEDPVRSLTRRSGKR